MTMVVKIARKGLSLSRARADEAGFAAPPLPASSGYPVDQAAMIVAPVDRIDAWLHIAKAGDRFAYATRQYLPPAAPGASRMRALSDQGLVHLVRKRSEVFANEFVYLAERTSRPLHQAMRPPRASRPAAAIGVENAVFDQISRAARFGRPCPTDRQLADRAGTTVDKVQSAIDALRAAGALRVQPAKAPTLRQVVIVETGHKTGLVA